MPFQVVPATGAVLEQVLDDTFPLWNDGLSRENYAKVVGGAAQDPLGLGPPRPRRPGRWSAHRLERQALRPVAAAGRPQSAACLGIGAVFTAAAYRGRGGARELLTRMLETAVAEGQEFAMLFSEIAPAFYERLDFVPVPLAEWTIEVDQKRGGAPAMLVRSGDDRDLHNIVEMSAARASGARLALDRSEDFIKFGISKKRLLSGFSPAGHARHRVSGRRRRPSGGGVPGLHVDRRPLDDRGGRRSRSRRRAARRDAAGDAGAHSERARCPKSAPGGRTRSCRRSCASRRQRQRKKC